MAGLPDSEKALITAACQRFIDDVLKPRFLPVIRPTEFNYPVDIQGKWHGDRYRFLQRYRSGFPDNLAEEFDAPFVRLDWVSRDRFNVRVRSRAPDAVLSGDLMCVRALSVHLDRSGHDGAGGDFGR